MGSLQFNTAPTNSNKEGIINKAADTINDNAMDSITTTAQGCTPRWVHFDFDSSLMQTMAVTLGMQQDTKNLDDKEDNQDADFLTVGLAEVR